MAQQRSDGPSRSSSGASSPVPSTTAHQAITAEASQLIRGWPMGAGLQGAADVISHLPPILPSPPSFFPSLATMPMSLNPATTSLVPSDPLFDQYSREIAALLAAQHGDPAVDHWRNEQVRQLVGLDEVQQELAQYQQAVNAGLPLLTPPYPMLPSAQLSTTPSSNTPALAASFLAATALPIVPPAVQASNPLQPRHLGPQAPLDNALSPFIDSHYASAQVRVTAATDSRMRDSTNNGGGAREDGPDSRRPETPSHPRVAAHQQPTQQAVVAMSSPDPLAMSDSSPVPPSRVSMAAPAAANPSSQPQQVHGGAAGGIRSSAPAPRKTSASVHPNPRPRKRSSSSDLSSHFSSPLKPSDAGAALQPLSVPAAQFWTPTTGNAAHGGVQDLGEPFAGAGSAFKRVKLGAGFGSSSTVSMGPLGRTPGTATTSTPTADPVERLGDLLSDIFGADDALVGDTSTAAMASSLHRSPSRKGGEKRLFRATKTGGVSGTPLLHTDALRKMLGLLRSVAAQGKAEELLEEAEEGGMSRWLKILERSWEGMGDAGAGWEGWEADALRDRDDEDVGGGSKKEKGKGQKKGTGRKGSASPVKGANRRAKGRRSSTLAPETDDADEDDVNMLGSPGRTGTSRSSPSASPRRDRSSTVGMADGADYAMDIEDGEEQDSQRDLAVASGESYWELDSSRLASTEAALRDLSDALLALRLALEILTLPGISLPKHLFSSEYLLGIVSTLRRALDTCLVPILEASSTSPLAELVAQYARDKIAEVTDGLVQGTQSLASLVRAEDLGDELVIALSYFSLEPFFHEAPLATTAAARAAAVRDASPAVNAIKSLRLASLSVVRAVYARYAEHRAWIIEEVLSNLGKAESASGTAAAKRAARRGVRLRTGATIQTISALLLHLVQTCPADLAVQVRKRLAKQAMPGGSDLAGANVDIADVLGLNATPLGDATASKAVDEDEDELTTIHRLLDETLDMSNKAARTIASFLLQRAAKAGKTTGVAADTEYRAVLDNLISDLLVTLHLPEWPGAELLLSVLCRSMMGTLADPKSTLETNALKGLALEHIGTIAARIRQDLSVPTSGLESLREAILRGDLDSLEKTIVAQRMVIAHLVQTESSDGSTEGVASYTRAQCALDILQALRLARDAELSQTQVAQDRLVALVSEVWKDEPVEDVFGPSPEDLQPRIDAVSHELWRFSSLAAMYQPIITRIVDVSESSQVGQRTKALRAISLIVAQDPDLFHQDNIRRSIENRMLDSSTQVRDTAIELVGKYVVGRPDLAVQYLPRLGERISDTGLAVRRRVIKLLRALYRVLPDQEHKVDISCKLVYRVLDEDDGIKDLAVEAIEDLWFGSAPKGVAEDSSTPFGQLASIITQTAGVFRDRPPPVDEALRLIISKHAENNTQPPLDRLRLIMESLIDGLVEDDSDKDLVAGVRTVYLLSTVDPALLSNAKATLLLPFLKSATTSEEQIISDYLLRILRGAVLAKPKTSTKFGRDLQSTLMPMLNKPSQNPATLQEVVACFCAVVHSQTQDFSGMVRVFGVSLRRLQHESQKLANRATAETVNLRTLPILCYMASLLCEHGDFDRIRDEQPTAKASIDQLTPNSIAELTYSVLIGVYNLSLPMPLKSAVLISLGFVYRAHPTLMLHATSTAIIDAIFESSTPQLHHQILRIVQDFLASQERAAIVAATEPSDTKRKKAAATGVKMDELVGDVEGFADSGVASAISQRYLKRIIDASLSPNPTLQRLGLDLLSTIARSGFSHPITLAPTLVALTASSDAALANKAYATLAILHQKHASLLVTRFLEPARAAHAFALQSIRPGGETLRGWTGDPPESLLGRWYNLLHKEKRQAQLDFLKSLARSFELEVGAPCSSNDVSFFRFLAEALSTFDYKRTEEPLLVITVLNAALAVAGVQILHALQEGLEGGGGLLAGVTASPAKTAASTTLASDSDPSERAPSSDLARQSLVLGLALLLRDHLKQLYGLSDTKLSKYVVGKKSAMGDKAASRNAVAMAGLGADAYSRMPLIATHPEMADEHARREQRAAFMRLISEDGTLTVLDDFEVDSGEDA